MAGASNRCALRNLSPLAALAGRCRERSERVRGSLRALHCHLNSLKQPLTPTLSPQQRGEGAHLARGEEVPLGWSIA
jgi:hypothetical protein